MNSEVLDVLVHPCDWFDSLAKLCHYPRRLVSFLLFG